ncbi:MAG: hypothetical protein K0R54_205 [Clostridiaceae bacterium]|jgi:hypothetical protein|nr:hypothetical protein [Clostridiaceae bacterium]
MKTLECSLLGDKNFSSHYAKVKVSGIVDTIERHYQLCKRFVTEEGIFAPQKEEYSYGKEPDFFIINEIEFPKEYLHYFYTMLWVKYFSSNPDLISYASNYKYFSDASNEDELNIKLDIIEKYVKKGRSSLIEDCEPFLKVLRNETMAVEIHSDIFNSNKNIIVNLVNCKGIMDDEFSLEIKKKNPTVYEDYFFLCKQYNYGRYNMGVCQLIKIDNISYIANLFIKEENKYSIIEYTYLEKALRKLKEEAKSKYLSIAIAKVIFTSENWDTSKSIIEEIFNDYPVTIFK